MKTEKKKTLRGSALFTVVAVMAILILFLTGTLALATASNSRAHKSYSISQASYTARSAIRSFKIALEDPGDGGTGIAAALYALGTGSIKELKPVINMGDNSMGRVGYWDKYGNWQENQILLEPVSDSVDWVYSDKEDKWVPYNVVRVTATCRLGREEETVYAYISKNVDWEEQESPISDSEVKGLQEANGNTFKNWGDIYGGLGIGLADDPRGALGEYQLNNKFHTHTTLNFINANIYNLTSDFGMYVENSTANPVAATVVMGNMRLKNDSGIILADSYEMKKNFRQKDIPYLYVDRLLYETESSNTPFVMSEGQDKTTMEPNDPEKFQPFNIYAGTMYYRQSFKAKADLYLMDSYSSAEKYDADELGFQLTKGDNYIGCDVNNNLFERTRTDKQLYKWVSDTFTRSYGRKDSYDSYGGNLYCNGNLHLGGAVINGDLRVQGDLIIANYGHGTRNQYITQIPVINGNLVVAGNIINDTDFAIDEFVKGGLIYNNGAAKAGNTVEIVPNPGYEEVKNALYPGYKEVETTVVENRALSEENGDIIKSQDSIFCNLDGNTYPAESELYLQKVPDGDGNFVDSSNPYIVTTDSNTRYVVDEDGNVIFTEDDEGKKIPTKTDKEYVYFDDEGNPCSESDAKGDYYIKSGDTSRAADFSEAFTVITKDASRYVSYDEYVSTYKTQAYPENMTREKIYGSYQNGKFVSADPSTKLITTLEDARKALNWNNTDGTFDETVYIRTEPSVDSDHIITTNKFQGNILTIKRPAEGAEWYVLDNVNLEGKYIEIEDNGTPTGHKRYGGGVIKFYIKGTLRMMHGGIRPAGMFNDENNATTVSYLDDFGIEYYSMGLDENSSDTIKTTKNKILIENGNGLIVGSIKAPTMPMEVYIGRGKFPVYYEAESGETVDLTAEISRPFIIGNALIAQITNENMNQFNLTYTKSGTGRNVVGGESGESVSKTPFGDFIFTYVVG